jgi:hypothetical protein
MLAEPLHLNDICYFWISFRQIGHMEKRSLQSGNTFFPVKKRRLRLSPVVFFYWKWLQDKSAQIWIHKRYCENALIS